MKRGPTSPLARFLANAKKHQGEGSSQEIPSEQMDMLQCLLDGQRAMQEDFQDLRVELKTSRTQITTIADKYEQLETNVSSIDTDFKDLLNELRDMKVKYESDHLIIKDLKRQLDYANSKIVSLETRLTSLSLEIRDRSLIINGIPEDDLTPLISQVHDILGKLFPSLHRTDIDLVYRTGARFGNTPRPVFVSFIRARDKREIFERRDTLRDDVSTKWIYVNEDIPPELRGPRADMRALAKYATEIGYNAKAVGDKLVIENRVFRANELHLLPPELSLEKVKIRNVPNGLAFQGEPAFLSNLHPANFVMRGIKFNCAEQAYQFYRAACVNNLEASQSILKCADPKDIRLMGKKLDPSVKWDQIKDEKMKMIVLNKFTQNKELALKLIGTGNTRLIEATRCPYWGAGLTLGSREWGKGYFPGQNKLGELIMEVREELRPLFQQAVMPQPESISPAEALALATSDRPDQVPLPPPHVMKQLVSQPPPSFATPNRFAILQDEGTVAVSTAEQLPPTQTVQTMAAAIQPTLVPPLKTDHAVPTPLSKEDGDKSIQMEVSTTTSASSPKANAPIKPSTPAPLANDNEDRIMDLIFRAQPGFSPEHSKMEVSDTKSSSLRSKLDQVVRKIIK